MKLRFVFAGAISLILAVLLLGTAQSGVYFTMSDPAGDEHGYGTYQYPTNIAFQPYQGLFDIMQFQVKAGPEGQIFFDTTFRKVTNPWAAPEGFIHQNLRIFIDSIPNQGAVVLPEQGANVRFNPKFAWDVCLKVVGWGNSQLLVLANGALQTKPLNVQLLPDGHTIRAAVPVKLLGIPTSKWHYYVFVGSYDGFGEDFFRKVESKPGEWVIGGGSAKNLEPRIMDLLAPSGTAHSQEKQLHSFDPATAQLAELYPVGRDISSFNFRAFLFIILFTLLFAALIYLLIKKRFNISWFWVKGNKDEMEV